MRQLKRSGVKTGSGRGKPVKAVIDTNVLVSGLFAGSGSVSELMELWYDRQFDLITSEEILSELYHVFHKPSVQKHFKPSKKDINEYL